MVGFPTSGPMGIDLTETSTVKKHPLGLRVAASGNELHVYGLAAAAITANTAVIVDSSGNIRPLTSTLATSASNNSQDLPAIAHTAIANGSYGFVGVEGAFACALAVSCAADVSLYTTVTAGTLDDASTGVKIEGVKALAGSGNANGTQAAGNYTVFIQNPWISGAANLAV